MTAGSADKVRPAVTEGYFQICAAGTAYHRITESQNGWVGRDLKDPEAQTPHHRQGHQPPHFIAAQAAQGPIQPGLEHLQGWTGHPQPLWVYYVLVDVLSFKYLEHIYTYSSSVTVAAGKR